MLLLDCAGASRSSLINRNDCEWQLASSGLSTICIVLAPISPFKVENFTPSNRRQRTGFTVGVVFLELNGFEIRASEEDVIQAIFAVAAGDLDEGGYAAGLGANTERTRNR
jgi:hypothetical protein